MNSWKAFVNSDSEFKNLDLESYTDTDNCRISTKLDPDSLKQCKERDSRYLNRSGIHSIPLTNDKDTPYCLGYAEMTLGSFHDILSKIHQMLGLNIEMTRRVSVLRRVLRRLKTR